MWGHNSLMWICCYFNTVILNTLTRTCRFYVDNSHVNFRGGVCGRGLFRWNIATHQIGNIKFDFVFVVGLQETYVNMDFIIAFWFHLNKVVCFNTISKMNMAWAIYQIRMTSNQNLSSEIFSACTRQKSIRRIWSE